jgi:plasmid stabilization system protein ParE
LKLLKAGCIANRKIAWSKQAISQFNNAITYITNDSVQNAEKVRNEILAEINSLPGNPEIHSPDKFKVNNNGNF